MSIGKEIKKARIDRGIKAKDLAAKVGIDTKYMSHIENDKAPGMTAALLARICTELGANPAVIMGLQAKPEEAVP